MKDHEGDIKQYIITSQAWYASTALNTTDHVDDVNFGFYSPRGGTSGEMSVCWHNLGEKWEGGNKVIHVAPRLECYNDAWHALAQFKDVIDAMAEVDDQDITPQEFCHLLERCGFVDATKRERS